MQDVDKVLEHIVSEYSKLLQENLVGIYLHGSLAMGCYNPGSSDIDFLVVVKNDMSFKLKRDLVDVLLELSGEAFIDLEMSVLLEADSQAIVYPTPFILHYSVAHKERYLSDLQYLCGNGVDEDLAAHITIVTNRGKCLVGKAIAEVFQTVPKDYYIQSMISDIEFAKNRIADRPVYITLNLCRVLYYLKEGAICSKQEGGEWGLKYLPVEFRALINQALLNYTGSDDKTNWDLLQLHGFAEYMKDAIFKIYGTSKETEQ